MLTQPKVTESFYFLYKSFLIFSAETVVQANASDVITI